MSAAPLNAKETLDQLQALAQNIDRCSDEQIRERARNPESRALILEMRQTLQPWLRIMNQLANVDRRLGKAIKRTERERRV